MTSKWAGWPRATSGAWVTGDLPSPKVFLGKITPAGVRGGCLRLPSLRIPHAIPRGDREPGSHPRHLGVPRPPSPRPTPGSRQARARHRRRRLRRSPDHREIAAAPDGDRPAISHPAATPPLQPASGAQTALLYPEKPPLEISAIEVASNRRVRANFPRELSLCTLSDVEPPLLFLCFRRVGLGDPAGKPRRPNGNPIGSWLALPQCPGSSVG